MRKRNGDLLCMHVCGRDIRSPDIKYRVLSKILSLNIFYLELRTSYIICEIVLLTSDLKKILQWSSQFFSQSCVFFIPFLFHFPMQTQNSTSILIFMLKRQITIKKFEKNQCQFSRHVTSGIHLKIYATVFLCFITGEYHGNLNIY